MNNYFLLSFLILAALLFIPVSKLIWVTSVRRLERKNNTKLSEPEIKDQLMRARVISIVLVLVFSYLFNISLGVRP